MSDSPNPNEQQAGPPSYENWRAYSQTGPIGYAYEVPIFTDAHIVGQQIEGFGPYQFWNAVPFPNSRRALRSAVVLRVEYALGRGADLSDMSKTDDKLYHGGTLHDEVAALLALCLGIRVQAGGRSREFSSVGDPRGHPVAWESYLDPVLPIGNRGEIIPHLGGEHNLCDLAPLALLVQLSVDDAIVLVRAARMYQGALWISQSQPELCWLMLLSAIETAANRWRNRSDSAIERMQASRPELVPILCNAGGETLVEQVANQIADFMGATKKFVDFVLEFLPPPPSVRPPQWCQLSWDESDIRSTMRIVYNYRSKALHGGKPFPAPMCEPPYQVGEGKGCAEVPIGLATGMLGGVWLRQDIPILLHTFAYITRGVLLNWWRSMVEC